MSDVWVKVKVPSELHRKFRLWSFENRCSMQGAILACIEKVCSAGKTPVEAPKRPSVKPEVVVKGIERGLGGDPVKAKSPFKYTPDNCPSHKFVNVGGGSRCMNCGVMA